MAQIGVQQPTNLMEMFSSPSPMLWDIAQSQVGQQRRSNEINQQQALQSMLFEGQDQPLKQRQLELQNQTAEAQLPGFAADSSLRQDKASLSRNTLPEQQRTLLSELAGKISKNDLDEAENAVKTALTHPSAKVREQANTMWQQLSHVREIKLKADEDMRRAMAVGAQNIEGQRGLEQLRIDNGKYKDKNAALGFWGNFNKLKSAKDKHAALMLEAVKEDQQGNTEGAGQLRQMAEEIRPQAEAEIGAKAQAPVINVPAVTGLPGVSPQSIAPSGKPKVEPVDLATPDAIKSAYKAGKISREQAKKELQQHGYQ